MEILVEAMEVMLEYKRRLELIPYIENACP
jgi:hypothetical protein